MKLKPPPAKYMALVSLVILLNIVDVATTVLILLYGGREANTQFTHFNVGGIRSVDYLLKGGLSVLWATVMLALYWISSKQNSKIGLMAGYSMLIAVNLFYLWVAANNLQVLSLQFQEWSRMRG